MVGTPINRSLICYTRLFTLFFAISESAVANDGVGDRAPFLERVFHWVPGELSLSLSGGVLYEDNLILEELDRVSRKPDITMLSSISLGYLSDVTGFDRVKLGYHSEQRQFQNPSSLDLQTQYGFVDYSHNFDGLRIGTIVDTTVADLGDARLLGSHQAGLYGASMAMTKLYVRGGIAYKQTEFSSASRLASETGKVAVDAYYFLQGVDEYIGLSYFFEIEDAQLDRLDYSANSLTLGYSRRLPWFERNAVTLKADWRFQYRQYLFPTPSISAPREDHRHRWRVRLNAPLTNMIDIEVKYEHRNYSSSLESLNLADDRFEVQLVLTL